MPLSDSHSMVTGRRFDQPEAMLDGSEHQITNVLTADPTCGSEETHGLAITAIEREGDPHPLTVVAADLKAIRLDGDAPVMSSLDAAGMAIKQQAVDLHHPVNPLVIGRLQASGQRLALEDGVDTSVATLPRCAVAFAIATDAVQDRCLVPMPASMMPASMPSPARSRPDACIHAIACSLPMQRCAVAFAIATDAVGHRD